MDFLEHLDQAELINDLMDLYLQALTSKQQQTLILVYREDMSYQEIAEQLGVSKQSVHWTVQQAIKRLQELEEALGFLTKKQQQLAYLHDLKLRYYQSVTAQTARTSDNQINDQVDVNLLFAEIEQLLRDTWD